MYELQYELNGRQCRIRLEPGATTLGRAPENDIVIDDRSVSGQHLRLEVREGEVELTDLCSSNGTFVNGRRIQSATIRGGETLRLGRLALSIADPDAPADGGGETLVTPAPGAAAAPGPDQTPVHQPAVAPAEPVVQPQAAADPGATPPAGSLVPTAARSAGNAVQVIPPGAPGAARPSPDAAKRKRMILVAVAVVAVVLAAGIVLLKPKPQNGGPVRTFGVAEYKAGLLQGLEAAEDDNFVEAHRVWDRANTLWEEHNPGQTRTAARRLANIVEDLAKAQQSGDYTGVDWYALSDAAREFHRDIAAVPDEVLDWVRTLDTFAMSEADAMERVRRARDHAAKAEYGKAREELSQVPEHSVYASAAAEVRKRAGDAAYQRLVDGARTYADNQRWSKAIEAAQEALRDRDNAALAAQVDQWRAWLGHSRTLDAAEMASESDQRADLQRQIPLLEAIPAESPYRREADALLQAIRLKLRRTTVNELFMANNLSALEKLPATDAAYEANPHYQNTVKKLKDIRTLFADAKKAEDAADFDTALALYDKVRDIAKDRLHPANKTARDRMAELAPSNRAERRLELGREAMKDHKYKQAREHFDAVKDLGVDAASEAADDEIAALLERARELYNKGVNHRSSRFEALEILQKALDCQRPGDPLYDKTKDRFDRIQRGEW